MTLPDPATLITLGMTAEERDKAVWKPLMALVSEREAQPRQDDHEAVWGYLMALRVVGFGAD